MGEFNRKIDVFLLVFLVLANQLFIFRDLQIVPNAQATDAPEPLDLVNTVNWFESADTIYAGMMCGKATIRDMIDCISRMTSWQEVIRWTARCKKFGSVAENRTKIQWALDNATMVSGMPATSYGYGNDYYSTYDGELIAGFNYSAKYSYAQAKWNATTAFNNFESAFNNTSTNHHASQVGGLEDSGWYGMGFLDYCNSTYIAGSKRCYDECAETMRTFLLFYQYGIEKTRALVDAEVIWNYLNVNYWDSTTAHFSYNADPVSGADNRYECEAGGFLEVVALLKYFDPNVGNMNRLTTDMQTRFLAQKWNSPQWTFTQNDQYTYYKAVNHEYTSNNESRLKNTVMAWAALLGIYRFLDSASRRNITDMLVGYSNLAPAWKLLRSSDTSLFDVASNEFRWTSDAVSSNVATAYGVVLSFLQCLVPINASLAVPIEELHYEYMLNLLDPELFSVSLNTRTVTISIFSGGTVEFILNGTAYHNFSQNGTYQIAFNPDWSSINSTTRISNLPSRLYLGNVAFDTMPPTYDNNTLRASNALSGSLCVFSCRWQDDVGLSGFVFEHNNTGTLKNETWVPFDSIELGNQWSNASLTLNGTGNVVIQWKFYVNDTSNNWNIAVPPQYLTIMAGGISMTSIISVAILIGGTIIAFIFYRRKRKSPRALLSV